MNSSNMINPANYYNPFAKYNYVSRTRGIYFPKPDSAQSMQIREVSANIYSESYDAETDVMQAISAGESDGSLNDVVLGLLNKFFPEKN